MMKKKNKKNLNLFTIVNFEKSFQIILIFIRKIWKSFFIKYL